MKRRRETRGRRRGVEVGRLEEVLRQILNVALHARDAVRADRDLRDAGGGGLVRGAREDARDVDDESQRQRHHLGARRGQVQGLLEEQSAHAALHLLGRVLAEGDDPAGEGVLREAGGLEDVRLDADHVEGHGRLGGVDQRVLEPDGHDDRVPLGAGHDLAADVQVSVAVVTRMTFMKSWATAASTSSAW